MRKLLLSLFVGYFFLCLNPVFGTDWGDSGLDKNDAPSEIYIAWEVTTQYGDPSSDPVYAYFAFANKDYNYMRIPRGAPDPLIDFMAMCVLTSTNSFDFYRTIANKVNIHLSQLDLDWLFYFTTKSGNPAKVTFRCLVNNLPANTTVSVRLLTVDNQEFPITALTEGATCEVTLPPDISPNSILASYEIPQITNAQFTLSLEPGWNLVGIPFLAVTDTGDLFDYPVMRCDAPAPTWVAPEDGLVSGASYWIYNSSSASQSVTLKGTARKGGETDFPELASNWNYLSPVGAYDAQQNTFVPATVVHDYAQWRWIPGAAFFRVDNTSPTVGVGYMVKE